LPARCRGADRAHGADPRRPALGARIFATARSTTRIIAAVSRGGAIERAPTRRRERCAADQHAVAVEQHDLDGDVAAIDAPRRLLRRARDLVAERDARRGSRQRERFRRGVGRGDARGKRGGAAGACAQKFASARSTSPRLECRSSRPCASLVILATPPAMVTRGTGWRRRYLSMPPTKSPMSISAVSGRP
jgi:hypothetical protein